MTEPLGKKGIQQLIAELCPDGVEYRELGLAMVSKTKSIAFDEVDANAFVTTENLLADRGGVRFPAEKPKSGSFRVFAPEDILISNIRPYLRKLWMSDRLGATSGGDVYIVRASDVPGLSSRFLYHCLAGSRFFDYATAHSGGGKMPRGNKASIKGYLIPVPPLLVQKAIVTYLDKFSQLEAELEAELVRRQKQYEWYRMHLLDFRRQEVDDEGEPTGVVLDYQYGDEYQMRPAIERVREMVNALCPDGVEWSTLGDKLEMRAGQYVAASQIAATASEAFPFPCYGGNNIRGFVQSTSHEGPLILIGRQGALCGNVRRISGQFYATEHAVVTRAKGNVNVDWAYHMLTAMNLNQYASKGAQPGLAVGNLQKIKFPVPPLPVQKAIVEILDQFDTLVTDMSAGIPAEIAARRKQYEYYREQLLSFEPKT